MDYAPLVCDVLLRGLPWVCTMGIPMGIMVWCHCRRKHYWWCC